MNSDPQRMWEVGRCITRGFTNHRGVARFWRDRLAVLVLMCVMGCGGSEPHRVPVEGRVTFRGQPIEKGSIVFIPTGDSKGPRAGTSIESGRYELEADRGPVIGT
ncbi:MAG: hypothetical protein O3A00_24655, partial [Planctomycetota bacterium]|nr:hypothetical protein [Planctomycetota bacterium]